MNLQENIQRIKEMMGLIIENDNNFQIENHKGYLITKPNLITSATSICILFNGYAQSAKSSIPFIPEELLNKKILISSESTLKLSYLIQEIEKLVKDNNSILFGMEKLSISSVVGHSMGCQRLDEAFGKYNFIAMIDPWITKDLLNSLQKNKENVICWYTEEFWTEGPGKITQTKMLQPELVQILGKNAVFKDTDHVTVAKMFIKEYENFF